MAPTRATPESVLKLVIIGIWVAAVTAAASYLSVRLLSQPASSAGESPAVELETLSTETTSVPVLRDGAVIGYVIVQLNFSVDKALVEKSQVEPQPFLVDAVFHSILQNTEADFTQLRPSDLDRLTEEIKAGANKRLGSEMVHAVLLQQLNYVRKEDIRTNWVKDNSH